MYNEYKCPKCQRNVPITNKIMHDLNCEGVHHRNVNSMPQRPSCEVVDHFPANTISQVNNYEQPRGQERDIDETFECDKCGLVISITEFVDHAYGHEIEESDYVEIDSQRNNVGNDHEEVPYNDNSNDNERNIYINQNNQNIIPQQYHQVQQIQHPRQHQQSQQIQHARRQQQQQAQQIRQAQQYEQQQQHQQAQQIRQAQYQQQQQAQQLRQAQQYQQSQQALQSQQVRPFFRSRSSNQNNQGYTTETFVEDLPNGIRRVTSITKDPYGNVVSNQSSQTSNGSNNGTTRIQLHFPGNTQMIISNSNQNQPQLNISNFNRHQMQNNSMNNPFFNQMILFNNRGFMNGIEEIIQQVMANNDHPVSNEVINDLPAINIDDPNKLDADKKQCVICLSDFKQGENGIILPCIHLFHSDCIKSWFQTQDTCPICKFKLGPNHAPNNYH